MKKTICFLFFISGYFAYTQNIENNLLNIDTLKLGFVGDISNEKIPLSDDLENYILSNNLLLFGNLETVVSDNELKDSKCNYIKRNCYAFRAKGQMIDRLKTLGFGFISIANNHALDFGVKGLNETKNNLKAKGIKYAGYGIDYSYQTWKTKKICFTAFSVNRNFRNIIDVNSASEFVANLKENENCDFLVVSFHGGGEGKEYLEVKNETEYFYGENRGNVVTFSRSMIDSGADFVFGHGPHIVRKMEVYKDKYIYYSLGNFSVNSRNRLDGLRKESMLVEGYIDSTMNFTLYKSHKLLISNKTSFRN